MLVIKKLRRPFDKLREMRRSSRETDVRARENSVELSTTDPQRQNDAAHMEQHDDQNPSSSIVEPSGEQQAITEQHNTSLPDPEPSDTAIILPEIAEASITPPERIWNEAYDSLKADQSKLVQAYEKILSSKLNGDAAVPMDQTFGKNIIQEESVSIRRAQMYRLIDHGLEDTEQEANIKGSIGTAMQVVNATKKMIGDTIKDIPQAALPWAIVSVSLEILANPISQTGANRSAIKYIGDTIRWYWEHATRLFFDDQAEHQLEGLQRELWTAFVDFYKELLQFQMKSICDYYRHRGLVFLRDLVKLDDWDESLKSIRGDDDTLRKKVNGFLRHKMESRFEHLTLQVKTYDNYRRTKEDQQCLRDLFITDPRDDITRIERTKGGLLADSYQWIFENAKYQEWHNDDLNQLLWLSGDPGKGKTMLLCGIIQELMRHPDPNLKTFFFCQATILSNNNNVSVLRGLIWLLADQQPSLISYIRASYDTAGQALFDGPNAWFKLSQILINMLCDDKRPLVCIIIDALDECTTGRTELLQLVQKLSTLPKVKLLVSSRNWPEIGGKLINEMNLSLEVNAGLVKTAVELYISYKASQLSILHDESQLKEELCHRMRNKANGTFLWVAIVFKSLDSIRHYDDNSKVLEFLDEMPEDLTQLYATMLERISLMKRESSKLCRTALAIATLVYRPLHLHELSNLAGFQNRLKNIRHVEDLINDCGSFLTVQENKVYFIHQSAKEYLDSDASSQSFIFPDRRDKVHYTIVSNSLDAMSQILRKNIYNLEHPGILIDDVCPPNDNPLGPILYSCANWVTHVCEINIQSHLDDLIEKEKILSFLKVHFLHWLEALSLTRNLAINTSLIKRFNILLKNITENELQKFLYDASRFMQYHSEIIETAPMQIYSSAVLFSPMESLVRSNFIGKLSSWITSTPAKDSHWSPCLQIIKASFPVVMDSRDTNFLMSNYDTGDIQIWDTALGRRIHFLNHTEYVDDAVFLSDSKHVLTVTSDQLMFWDIISGTLLRSISITKSDFSEKHAISKDGKFIATYLHDNCSIQIYSIVEATSYQFPLEIDDIWIKLTWSDDSKLLGIESSTLTVCWDVAKGAPSLKAAQKHFGEFTSFSFSTDSKLLAFIDRMSTGIMIWDLSRDEKVSMIIPDIEPGNVGSFQFSKDSTLLAILHSTLIEVRDVATGQLQHNIDFGIRRIFKFAWLNDSETFAVSFNDSIEIHDFTQWRYRKNMLHDTHNPVSITFLADSSLVATVNTLANSSLVATRNTSADSSPGSHKGLVDNSVRIANENRYLKIWNSTTGSEVRTILGIEWSSQLLFSQDSKCIFVHTSRNHFEAWDIDSGSPITYPAELFNGREIREAFSATVNQKSRLWALTIYNIISCSKIPEAVVECLALSNNDAYLVVMTAVIAKDKLIIDVWSTESEEKLWTVDELISTREDDYTNEPCGACDQYGRKFSSRSIAVSNDGRVLYVKPLRHEMLVWSEGKKIFKLSICSRYFDPIFDIDSQYILTQVGRIHLDKLIAQAAVSSDSKTPLDYQWMTEGHGITTTGYWVTWNGKNILWLPPDYRPSELRAVSRHRIAVKNNLKGTCIISFSDPPPFNFLV